MGTNSTKVTKPEAKEPHESCEVRERIFTYFRRHGARGLRDELLCGERTKAFATIRTARDYNIAIYFAQDGKVWTYVYSKDPDGKLDRKILREIERNPSTGAKFEDCSNKKSFERKSRNVLKLHRPFDWRTLTDKQIGVLLDDYNWLVSELERIGVM